MTSPKRFTARVRLADGSEAEILVPFLADGSLPERVTLGAGPNASTIVLESRTPQDGKFIYREEKLKEEKSVAKKRGGRSV